MGKTMTTEKTTALKDIRTILLIGEINDTSTKDVVVQMLEMNAVNHNEITLIINSEGGHIENLFMVTDVMENIASPVKTVGIGCIYSAGLLIFMAGNKGRRIVSRNTSIMSHRFWSGTVGDHEDLVSYNDFVNHTHEKIIQHYIKHTGLTRKIIMDNLLKESNYWFGSKEAIKFHLADKIMGDKI